MKAAFHEPSHPERARSPGAARDQDRRGGTLRALGCGLGAASRDGSRSSSWSQLTSKFLRCSLLTKEFSRACHPRFARCQASGTQGLSHGVASENNPRREPWEVTEWRRSPGRGERTRLTILSPLPGLRLHSVTSHGS